MPGPYRAAIVTVSDSVAQSTREDLSGPAVRRVLEGAGWTIKSTEVLPDDFSLIRERLGALASDVEVDAVFTTGGTGGRPRDPTPEAPSPPRRPPPPGRGEGKARRSLRPSPPRGRPPEQEGLGRKKAV